MVTNRQAGTLVASLYNTVPRRQDVVWRRRLSPIMLETYLNKCLTEVS